MNKKGITCLTVVILSVNVVHCGVLHHLLDRIALNELGLHAHKAAYSVADAASSAYGSFRNYFTNIYPRPVQEAAVLPQQLGVASCASSASSAQSADALAVPDVPVLPAPENLLPQEGLIEPAVIVPPPVAQPPLESAAASAAAAAAAAAENAEVESG